MEAIKVIHRVSCVPIPFGRQFELSRPVTVPSQFKEMELFRKFSFMGTGTGDQFTLPELKPMASSFHLNWDR